MVTRILTAAGLLLAANLAMADSPTCSSAAFENKVSWPDAVNPVWEMCWLTPQRSSGPRGSGLELRNVHYRGKLVLKRAHAPILFAEYRNGAGGDCYRDWKDANSPFAAETSVRNILGTPTNYYAKTTCDVSVHPTQAVGNCPYPGNNTFGLTSADCMSAGGVAIENLPGGGGFVLTSQYAADWYKYSSRFFFYENGDIEPVFGFGNSTDTFNNVTHWHHNYWRFDFDLDGPENDVIIVDGVNQTTEFSLVRDKQETRVFDPMAGFGYIIETGPNDNKYPPNQSGRGMHTTDIIGTRYGANEYSDRPNNSLGDCQMIASNLANGESLVGQDIVLYYRVSARDQTANNWPNPGAGAEPQDSLVCKEAGPRLRYFEGGPMFQDGFED